MIHSLARPQDRAHTILTDDLSGEDDQWLSPTAIAAETGVTVGTLANWRSKKVGPPFYKFGKKVRYRRDEYCQWKARSRIRTRR